MPDSARKGRIAVVDDETELMSALCESLNEQGFDAIGFNNPLDGLRAIEQEEFDVILSDLMMLQIDGVQFLRQAFAFDPNLVGVIMTGQGSIATAVEAMKAGAFDYILKPFRLPCVLPVLDRAMEVRRLRMENVRLKKHVERLTFESPRYSIIGESPALTKVLQIVEKVAATDATVLIRGPSGSGKELIARAIHGNSPRRQNPLVTINCATLQEQLLESELFGHERGAFTGADKVKPGLFEAAEGGTLFVDEVAEMAPLLQAKLLRVLEDGHYRRVGRGRRTACQCAGRRRDQQTPRRRAEGRSISRGSVLPPERDHSRLTGLARTARRHSVAGRTLPQNAADRSSAAGVHTGCLGGVSEVRLAGKHP